MNASAKASGPTVFIVDDDAGMRRSTAVLLEVAGLRHQAFETAGAFLDAYTPERRGCLLLDLQMPGMSGMELVHRMRERRCLLPIVVVSGTGSIPVAVEGMKLGVHDFLEKPVDSDVLLAKVRSALETDARQRAEAAEVDAARARLSALTPRERELLKLVVAGKSNKRIAEELDISVKTVENHRASLMQKTGATNAVDLTRLTLLGGEA